MMIFVNRYDLLNNFFYKIAQSIPLHFNPLCCTSIHCIALQSTVLHFNPLYCTSSHCVALCSSFHSIPSLSFPFHFFPFLSINHLRCPTYLPSSFFSFLTFASYVTLSVYTTILNKMKSNEIMPRLIKSNKLK